MKAQMRDIEEIGVELTEEQIGLVAGGCGPTTCTNMRVVVCGRWPDGSEYCNVEDRGDVD
jgi:hypothetical protein